MEQFLNALKVRGEALDITCGANVTALFRTCRQIDTITGSGRSGRFAPAAEEGGADALVVQGPALEIEGLAHGRQLGIHLLQPLPFGLQELLRLVLPLLVLGVEHRLACGQGLPLGGQFAAQSGHVLFHASPLGRQAGLSLGGGRAGRRRG